MNYIEQINNFWSHSEESDLSGLDVSVYMALLKYCNTLGWKNPFICHWDIVCQTSKVSKTAYYGSLERLEKFGFITYEKGIKNSNKKPKIFILELRNKDGINAEQRRNNEELNAEQRENKDGINAEQRRNLNKLINNKTNKLINISESDILIILSHFDNLPKSELKKFIKEISEESGEAEKIPFSVFWDLYDKKEGDKDKCKDKWDKLALKDQQKSIDTIPAFKAKHSEKKYRPLPATYLNQKRWNDELDSAKTGIEDKPKLTMF